MKIAHCQNGQYSLRIDVDEADFLGKATRKTDARLLDGFLWVSEIQITGLQFLKLALQSKLDVAVVQDGGYEFALWARGFRHLKHI